MRPFLKTIQGFAARHYALLAFLAAFVAYALCTLFYMGGALTNCTEALLTFPGDNTAGMIALFEIDSHDPWWGRSDAWSYPYGESIGQPTHITAQTLFIPFWLLAKAFGPVCGFNLLTFIGFVSAALTMFAFVRWLLGGRLFVAFIAGFAVAFTPYLQIKTGVHISYVFEAFFIAAIWLFLWFWRNPSWKKAVLVGLSMALFAYTDGYFILLGGVLMATLIVGALGFDFIDTGRHMTKELQSKLRLLLIAIGTAGVVMLPVLYVQLTAAGQINELLAKSRDSIYNETQVYGARPAEYILPNAFNPIFDDVLGPYAERDNHGSNPGENVLSLSLVLFGFATYFVVRMFMIARKAKEVSLKGMSVRPLFIAAVFGLVFVAAFVLSLPPKLGPLPMPSRLLIEATQLWRVLARLSVIVNIAMVVLAAGGLALLLERIQQQWKRLLVYGVVLALIFLEYLTFIPPRPVQGYEKVPELYYWLRTQEQYKEIAEYPLFEFPQSHLPVFYNTYQRIHGKKMLNGAVSERQPLIARLSVRNLENPQSVKGLRSLGIDFIIIHSPDHPGNIEGLRFAHESVEPLIKSPDGRQGKVWGYAVLPGEKAPYGVAAVKGFHAPIPKGIVSDIQKMGHEGVMSLMKLDPRAEDKSAVRVAIHAQAIADEGQEIVITQLGKELWVGMVAKEGGDIEFVADPQHDIHVIAIRPTGDATLLLPTITTH